MTTKQAFKVVAVSIVLSFVLFILLGRFVTAEISTFPLLNRWKLLSPQAPIVINTREEVRVTDSGDVIKTINDARSKISAVLVRNGNTTTVAGGSVNLTSDGLFLTTKEAVANQKLPNLFVKLDDGSVLPVVTASSDPSTDLVVLKTSGSGLPVANIVNTDSLVPGQRVMLIMQNLSANSITFGDAFVSSKQETDPTTTEDSNLPRRAFSLQVSGSLSQSEVIVNQNGEIIGLWNGSYVISGDVMKDFLGKFLQSAGQSFRVDFGFRYQLTNPYDQKILNLPYGAQVASVVPNGPAQKAGLEDSDLITAVGGKTITQDSSLEVLLQSYKAGDKVALTVLRNKATLTLNIVAGELK